MEAELMKRTTIDQHKRARKVLTPPLRSLTAHRFVHWYPHELPNYLWLCILFSEGRRAKSFNALRPFFEEPDLLEAGGRYDVDFQQLSQIRPRAFDKLIAPLFADEELATALSALSIIPAFPSKSRWRKYLKPISPEQSFQIIVRSVGESQYQNSQPATDAAFVLYFSSLLSGHLQLSNDILERQKSLLTNYPELTDYDYIGGGIRSFRNMVFGQKSWPKHRSAWADRFWSWGHRHSGCVVDPFRHKEERANRARKHLPAFIDVAELLDGILRNSNGSVIRDQKKEVLFGLPLYVIELLVDTTYSPNRPAPFALMGVRSAAEAAITLKHISSNEEAAARYRAYGTGKAKLASLKLDELVAHPRTAERNELFDLANDDGWEEYVDVDVGSQFGEPIRQTAERLGMKQFYDRYFGWQSSFVHAEWGAVRASVYERCYNPLHEWHLVSTIRVGNLNKVIFDLLDILDSMIETLSTVYPDRRFARILRLTERIKVDLARQ